MAATLHFYHIVFTPVPGLFKFVQFLKGAKVAPGGFGFRTCPSNIINNKTLAVP